MNYRYDSRSKEEFSRDIKDRTEEERSLFYRWLDLVERETGKRPVYTYTGCGESGEFLEDDLVNARADFNVEGYGNVEIKFSKPRLDKFFHLKVGQVKKYIKQAAIVLMVNGSSEAVPSFTVLKTDSLQRIVQNAKVVDWKGFGGKAAYRISVNDFIWRPLS